MDCKDKDKKEIIKKAIDNKWEVCCYGLGFLGKKLYSEIPSIFNLKATLLCDGNDRCVEVFSKQDTRAIYLKELLIVKKDILVFVLVDDPMDGEIIDNLCINPCLHLVTLRDLLNMEDVVKYYFDDELYDIYSQLEVQKGF